MSTLAPGQRSRPEPGTVAVLVRAVDELAAAPDAQAVREVACRAACTITGAADATFVGAAATGASGPGVLVLPVAAGEPLGAIEVRWTDPRPATAEEAGLGRALADCTAAALERLRAAEEQALERARDETDPLTGVANDHAFDAALAAALHHATGPLCVAVLDLDFFGAFNAGRGRGAGDELLKTAAAIWRSTLRDGDLLARTGGEEFCVLLPGCSASDAHVIAERLRRQVPSAQTVSVGLAQWDRSAGAGALVAEARAALAAAKAAGRNRTVVA